MALISACLAVVCSARMPADRPAGLYVGAGRYYYFLSGGKGTGFASGHAIVFKEPKGTPDGGLYGIWHGWRIIFPKILSDEFDPSDEQDSMSHGDYRVAGSEESWTLTSTNATKSDRIDARLRLVSSSTPEFFTGVWRGGGYEFDLRQDGKEVKGTATYQGVSYAVSGERLGSFCGLRFFDEATGKKGIEVGMAWNPTSGAIGGMYSDGKFRNDRVTLFVAARDKKWPLQTDLAKAR